MGWASGSSLAEDVWNIVRSYIPETDRKKIVMELVDRFEDDDCDTLQEVEEFVHYFPEHFEEDE